MRLSRLFTVIVLRLSSPFVAQFKTAILLALAAPALAANSGLRKLAEGGKCHRLLEAIREDQPDFDPSSCMYNPVDENGNGFPDRYTGCWFDGSFAEDVSGENVDEFCECYLSYEKDCLKKIPFGELPGSASNQRPVQWSQLVSGNGMTPKTYSQYCEFAGVWTGDFDAEISEDLMECGCLWIDMVEDFIDECPGVEFVPPEDLSEEGSDYP